MNAVLSRLDEPLPLGYSAAGVVVEVGADLEGSLPHRRPCGGCWCRRRQPCRTQRRPEEFDRPHPHDVSDEDACYGTLAAIALHAVRNLDAKLGETVAVLGLGLVGQLAAQFLALSGVRVAVLDYDQGRLDLAQELGSEKIINLADADAVSQAMAPHLAAAVTVSSLRPQQPRSL